MVNDNFIPRECEIDYHTDVMLNHNWTMARPGKVESMMSGNFNGGGIRGGSW